MHTENRRARAYRVLEIVDTRAGRGLNAFLMALIGLNVVAVILESVPSLQREFRGAFGAFEAISIGIFTIEYVARVWAIPERAPTSSAWRSRLRYLLTPMAVVDLLAILPFYFGAVINVDTRFLRALRLLRVFKLARHSTSMDLLLTVMRNEAAAIGSAIFIMFIVIVLAASGIHLIERDAQPEAFASIPQAMWWAAVTLTTVGYGDVLPVTTAGKVFGLAVTIAGVGMVALPAGILASGFSQELARRRSRYRLRVRQSLADGRLSPGEMQALRRQADEMGLDADDARVLLRSETAARAPVICPHCGREI